MASNGIVASAAPTDRTVSRSPITNPVGDWDKGDIAELLKTGATPEQSKVKGAMREAVEDGLKHLSNADRDAIADYLLAQPSVAHEVNRRR